ncbi:MAG TPA: ABC transporter permease [Kofleriaceae bacterium]|nr:ABC transporter permease [Kofleriaceae bacterium]
MIPVSYNVRSLLNRKTTTIATALGIGLVVFVLAAVMMLGHGLEQTLSASGQPDNGFVIRKGSDGELSSTIDNQSVNLILSAPGVKKDEKGRPIGVGEVVVVILLERPGGEGKLANVTVRGTGEKSMAVRPNLRVVDGRPPQPGTDEVMIGSALLGRFAGLELGASFELKKNRRVKVVGVFEAGGSAYESEVWADLDTVRTSFGRTSMVSSVIVRLESPSKFDGFAQTVETDKSLGLNAMRETEYFNKQAGPMLGFIMGLGISIAILFAIGSMIGAVITMYGAVAQRSREIGTLRALGFSRFAILGSFLFESIALAVLGGLIGVVAALGASVLVGNVSMTNFSTWSEIVFRLQATPAILVWAVVIGAVMGLLGGFFPAIRAARMSPIAAMRD